MQALYTPVGPVYALYPLYIRLIYALIGTLNRYTLGTLNRYILKMSLGFPL